MKSRSIFTLAALAFGLVISTSGCASLRKPATVRQPAPTYALAVTVVGGQQPTAQQWADLRSRFGQVLAARGLVLVNDIGQASQVIMVELTPDTGESSFGTAVVTGIVPNVLAYASITQPQSRGTYPGSYPLSYGYMGSFGMGAWPSFTNYNSTFYGYTDPFGYANNYNYNTGDYTVTPGTSVTPPDKPPHDGPPHWNPNDPTDHTPGTGDHPPRTGDRPPWTDRPTPPTNVVHDHPRPTPPADGDHHWWSGRGDSSPTSPVQPRSEPTYSASSSSSSSDYSSSSSSSSSYSAPSYSPPPEPSSPPMQGTPMEGGPARAIQQN
jgi:hypothetical protein